MRSTNGSRGSRSLRRTGNRSSRAQRRRPQNGNGNSMRTGATRVLAQGVAAVPRKAFGGGTYGSDLRVWDAKLPMHLPLPRAVGPYTIIRTTRRIAIGSRIAVLGCYKHGGGGNPHDGYWSDICAQSDVTATNAINGVNNTNVFTQPLDGLGTAATVCPSAFSVQIMNPGALQTTSGIIYMGTMNTQAKIGGRTESWDTYANKFVQFQNPRLLSAGRLALKGVQVDSYPLNMGEISEFTPLHKHDGGSPDTWGDTSAQPSGWAPIIVYNANAPDGPILELLVTTEWRVRFDLDNPASAGHTQHPTATDSLWDRLTRTASARAHNVRDISDAVSDIGSTMNTVNVLRRALTTSGEVISL